MGETTEQRIKRLEKALAAAQRKSMKAAEARARLPAGATRARVTTANARWARAAEERDRIERELRAAREEVQGGSE